MLKEKRDEKNYNEWVLKIVSEIEKMGYSEIRAEIDDYEAPKQIKSANNSYEFAPDLTAAKNGAKTYIEIATKSNDKQAIVNKWKILETLAGMKNGEFMIFVPRGHMQYTNNILKEYNISADVAKL